MEKLLKSALEYGKRFLDQGTPANYIPELAKADSRKLGISIVTVDNRQIQCGDCQDKFTIQSISKVISLLLALEECGAAEVFSKVGMEPTGDSFNSIIRLDQIDHITPFNPMINAGAIVTVTNIKGENVEKRFAKILNYTRKICGNPDITYNENVYRSEKMTGDKNRAIAYLMKANKVFPGDVEEHLELYFKICSIEITCNDIAHLGAVLSNGHLPKTGERMVTERTLKIVRTLMATCGMYNESGEFAIRVGLPSKSGVGGGIVSVVPNSMGIGTYGPALDGKGNSVGGMKMLQYLSEQMNLGIF